MGGETEAAAEPSGAILQSPQTTVWHCPPPPRSLALIRTESWFKKKRRKKKSTF